MSGSPGVGRGRPGGTWRIVCLGSEDGEDGEDGWEDGCKDGTLSGCEDGCEDGMMGGWVSGMHVCNDAGCIVVCRLC